LKKGRVYVIFKAPSTKHQAPSTKHQAPSTTSTKSKLGFTLSELLVSLAVLGLIAGLTVPSVINSVEKAKTKALQKETIQVISQIMQEGVMNGDFTAITNWNIVNTTDPLVQYFTNKFNAKQCPRGTTTPPCDHNSLNAGVANVNNDHSGRWVLNNGVKISLFYHWTPQNNGTEITVLGFMIDTKPEGTNVPAVVGGDQLMIGCNYSDTPLTWYACPGLKSAQCGAGEYFAYNFKPQFDAL
jgi:prepilin-type N-terminal cleavage/methylation domain-containing protein